MAKSNIPAQVAPALQGRGAFFFSNTLHSNQVGDIQKDKLPGPEALQTRGKKDGQVKKKQLRLILFAYTVQVIMVRKGENVEAHMWSASTNSWTNVGQVVDSVGSGRKRLYEGKEYDFVFDVDIQEGAPPLKLPYNASENPFDAARRFLENNELPISYLDTVGNFIVQNSRGVNLGQPEPSSTGPEPWGSESRYRPGGSNTSHATPPPPPPPSSPNVVPQTEYLTITATKIALVEKKARQINEQLIKGGQNDIAMDSSELEALAELCRYLGEKTHPAPIKSSGLKLLEKLVKTWPPEHRLPILDLLRLAAAASPLVAEMNLVDLFVSSETISKEHPNNAMLAVRAFVNLFQTEDGRKYGDGAFEEVCPYGS